MSFKLFWSKKKREGCTLGKKLTDAIRANSVDTVERLLTEARRKHRDKAVHLALRQALSAAVQEGRPQCVEMLIQAGCDPRTTPALFKAAEHGHEAVIELLLERGCDIDHRYTGSNTALHVAAAKGYVGCARLLLSRGADPTLINSMQDSALTMALNKQNVEMLAVLLKHEEAIRHADAAGRTLLHLACRSGHPKMVNTLLAAGCNPNVLDSHSHTPLMDAVLWRHLDVVECLAPRCNVNFPGQRNTTALIYAAQTNEPASVTVLLQEGAGVNDQDAMGNTALILGGPYCVIIESLVTHRADPNIQNHYGMTALWYAAYHRYPQVAALLLQANANPALVGSPKDEFRTTPFEIAFKRGHLAICGLMLIAGIAREVVRPLLSSNLTRSFAQHPSSEILLGEMREYVSRPPTLTQTCRMMIRKCLGSVCMQNRVNFGLPLPQTLKAYVCLQELHSQLETT